MVLDKITSAALEGGRLQAKKVLKRRALALKKRDRVVRHHTKKLAKQEVARALAREATTTAAAPLMASQTVGVVVAEGDSWFDYPFHDILKFLEDDHGYDVESVAHKGDPIEVMAYGEHQLIDFTRCIEKVLRRGVVPKAILLSGGGNDIAGDEFSFLINHCESAIAGINRKIAEGIIYDRIRTAYIHILGAVTGVCTKMTGGAIPILVHGYDYPVPDGRGFAGGGWGPLPGPWLEPGFRQKGFMNVEQRVMLMQILIDNFNAMLAEVTTLAPFQHVKYVDLRNTLAHGVDYEDAWANELHPTKEGFSLVTEKFAAVLATL